MFHCSLRVSVVVYFFWNNTSVLALGRPRREGPILRK